MAPPPDHPTPSRSRFRSQTRQGARRTFDQGADRLVLAVRHADPDGIALPDLARWVAAYGAALLAHHRFDLDLLLGELERHLDVTDVRGAIAAEHAELAGAVTEAGAAVGAWAGGGVPWAAGRRRALDAVTAQRDDLLVHTHHEDALLLPLADAHLLDHEDRIDRALRAHLGEGPGGLLTAWLEAEADHHRRAAGPTGG